LTNGNGANVKKLVVFGPRINHLKFKTLTPYFSKSQESRDLGPELLIIAPAVLKSSAEKLLLHKLSIGVFAGNRIISMRIYDSFGYGNSRT